MACNGIHSWTVTSLIATFFKLVLSGILLWAASIAFVVAKFLRIFGFHLPCTCYEVIEDQSPRVEEVCLQGILVRYPNQVVSSATSSLLHKFPFEGTFYANSSSQKLGTRALNPQNVGVSSSEGGSPGAPGLPGTTEPFQWSSPQLMDSTTSVDPQDKQAIVSEINNDPKVVTPSEKKVCCQEGKCCLHCACTLQSERDFCGSQLGESSTVGLEDKAAVTEIGIPLQEKPVEMKSSASCENSAGQCGCKDETVDGLVRTMSTDVYIPLNLGKCREENINLMQLSGVVAALEKASLNENQEVLESVIEAIKAEREAQRALYVELEKERVAASSAAEEAMAMILRLQEEKASIEMELRQYKRESGEKLVHDEQEIETLREILLRREKEHLLVAEEVEMYRYRFSEDCDSQHEGSLKLDSINHNSGFQDCNEPVQLFHDRNSFTGSEGSYSEEKMTFDVNIRLDDVKELRTCNSTERSRESMDMTRSSNKRNHEDVLDINEGRSTVLALEDNTSTCDLHVVLDGVEAISAADAKDVIEVPIKLSSEG